MNGNNDSALVEQTLTRAGEELGDITPAVMELFYRRFPQAAAMFDHHGGHRRDRLEAEMVEQAVYCLMTWLDAPAEVEIVLAGSVPHHNDTLQVPADIYQGLLHSTAEVIGASIPAQRVAEREAWAGLCAGLDNAIANGRRFILQPA